MKVFSRALLRLLFVGCLATFASAQIPALTFKHIIIVIQENRTPDNLFGYWATGQPSGANCPPSLQPFAGADIYNGGKSVTQLAA